MNLIYINDLICIKIKSAVLCYGETEIQFNKERKYDYDHRNSCHHHDLDINGSRNFLRLSRRLAAQKAEALR